MLRTCLLVLFLLFAAACAQDEKAETPAPEPSLQVAPTETPSAVPTAQGAANGCGGIVTTGSTAGNLVSSEVERFYRLYVPQSYAGDKPVPLVLNLHGYGSNATEQERYADLIDDAESAGFLLVTPEATGETKHWYVLGPLERGYVDDLAFLNSLLDDLERNLCVDPARIYAAGISNGGGMATLLACAADQRIAAVALVAGAAYPDDCANTQPIPVLAFHGTADFIIPFEAGTLGFRPSIDDVVDRWAAHNGCSPMPRTSPVAADVELLTYQDCGAEVEFYVIENGGHTWPGTSSPKPLLGRTTQTIDASAIIWEFFSRH